jgi:hypothetical protein
MPKGRDDKLPSLEEADLEGQFRLKHLDPMSKDGCEIAGIASTANLKSNELRADSIQWMSRERADSHSS